MEEKTNSNGVDITTEKYQGTGPFVSAAGNGYLAHFYFAIAGLVGGGLASYIFHKPVNKFMAGWKKNGMELAESSNAIKRYAGRFSGWLVGFEEGTLDSARHAISNVSDAKIKLRAENAIEGAEGGFIHSLAHKFVKFGKWLASPFSSEKMTNSITKNIKDTEARADAAMLGGGLLGSAGFLLSPFLYAPGGASKAIRGREQVEALQEALVNSRAQTDAYKTKYEEVQLAHEKAGKHQGGDKDDLVVAADQPPQMQSTPSEEGLASLNAAETKPPHREAPKPTLDAGHAAHHGKLHHDHAQELTHAH